MQIIKGGRDRMAKPNMDGFASKAELKEFAATDEAFQLGRIHPDHGVRQDAGIADDRHLFIVAGSRAGKGTTMIIPNLIHWQGGTFNIDPKGENASITAMRRGTLEGAIGSGTAVKPGNFLGQKVAILDPMGTVRGPARIYRTTYDPLRDVAIHEDEEAGQILAIAESLVISETGSSSHFSESAQTLLAGLIEAVLHNEKDRTRHTLTFLRAVAFGKGEGLVDYLEKAPDTPAGLAAEAHAILESVGEDEGGSMQSTLSRSLKWIADPRAQRHLEDSDFSLVTAMREGWSIYVCIPPAQIPRMSRWLRVIVRMALEAKMTDATDHHGQQTLFMLDEFAALGHFQLIEDAAAYMAGYGIKLVPVIQNLGQVKKLYERNWETFLGNAGAIIAWGLNDLETEKYVSDRMGPVMAWEETYGDSQSLQPGELGVLGSTMSRNLAQRERAIRWPNEVHYQGAREQLRAFVIPAAGAPLMVERSPYWDQANEGMFDSPTHITKWESNLQF